MELFQEPDPETASMPDELKHVLRDLPEGVSEEDQVKIEQLLRQHRHLFATKEEPLRGTELVARKIEAGAASWKGSSPETTDS